jgi:hypothetical protein
MLKKDLLELVKKYSFITDVEISPTYFTLFYFNEGKRFARRITRRATVSQIQEIIKRIEQTIVKTPYGKGLKDDIYIVGVGEDND